MYARKTAQQYMTAREHNNSMLQEIESGLLAGAAKSKKPTTGVGVSKGRKTSNQDAVTASSIDESINKRIADGLKMGLQAIVMRIDALVEEKVRVIVGKEVDKKVLDATKDWEKKFQAQKQQAEAAMNSVKTMTLVPPMGLSRQYCRSPLDNFCKLSTMSTFNSTKMDLKKPSHNTSRCLLQSTNFCKNTSLGLTAATAIPEEESYQKPNGGDGK